MSVIVDELKSRTLRATEGYAPGQGRPLAGYTGAITTFVTAAGALSALARFQRRPLPSPVLLDVVLMACATHKLARLISKENVTSAIRAPFTEYVAPAGPGELHEEVRGTGFQHAVGELITCPFCLAPWLAGTFSFGLIFAPKATRLVAVAMTAVAGADFLQLAYAWGQQKASG
jgi:hypothetical protein